MFRRLLIVVTILWMSFFALLIEAKPSDDIWVLLGLMLIPPAAIWWVFYGDEW